MVGAGLTGTTVGAPDLAIGYLGAIMQELVWAGATNPVLTWRDRATGALVQCHYERDVTPDGEGVTDRSCRDEVAPVSVEPPGLGESAAGVGLDTAAGAGADLFIEQLAR
jgi:hypothetical protein